jgi:predicted small metal-binding protein
VKEVTCLCGWRCRGTEDEIVDQVIAHGREAHNIESTREEVLALAVDVPAPRPGTGARPS